MSKDENVDGPGIAAAILERMNPENKQRILERMEESAPELAEKVEDRILNLEKLGGATSKNLQSLAQKANFHDLAIALSESSAEVREKLLSNMTARRREIVEEEMRLLGNIKPKDLTNAKRRVLSIMDEISTPRASDGLKGFIA